MLYFNSIKVRLEPAFERVQALKKKLFQFHKGAIRTLVSPDDRRLDVDFNSIKVRLELGYHEKKLLLLHISIP